MPTISDIWQNVPEISDLLRYTALILLSCVVPIGIFVGRNNIRASRREVVRDAAIERVVGAAREIDVPALSHGSAR